LTSGWLTTGLWMLAHMAGALLLGWTVGYERRYSGRAAGSQVYCLVCTTSCAVTLLAGYPELWYWASSHDAGVADPTHVINSILTGIGFLGAGIIVKSGLNVRGLTTAASIWGSSAIGILVGIGFYLPAVGLTALFVISTAIVPLVERHLPARVAIAGTIRFREGYKPDPEQVHRYLGKRGMTIPPDSLSITHSNGRFELQCLIVGDSVARTDAMSTIAFELSAMPNIEGITISHSSRA